MAYDTDLYLADPSALARRTGLDPENPSLLEALAAVSDRFRDAIGHRLTTTTTVHYATGNGGPHLQLPGAPIQGTPEVRIGEQELTDFETGRRTGTLRRRRGWPVGLENIEISYTYGLDRVPAAVSQAVLDAADLALNMAEIGVGIDSVTTGDESVRLTRALAGGGTTPEWNAAVNRYSVGMNGDAT